MKLRARSLGLPFATREETILVRGGEPERLTVRETRHGPVISDVEDLPLAPGALAVVEEAAGAVVEPPAGYEEIDRRTYGDTQVLFLRAGRG